MREVVKENLKLMKFIQTPCINEKATVNITRNIKEIMSSFPITRLLTVIGCLFLINLANAQTINFSQSKEVLKPKITKTAIGNSLILVQYEHHHQTGTNPYLVRYEYKMLLENNEIIFPAKSLLNDLDMYFDDGIEIQAKNNDKVAYPINLTINQVLNPVSTEYVITTKTKQTLLVYGIDVSNRKVIDKEVIQVNSEDVDAYKIQSQFNVEKRLTNGQVISSSEETITDWFVPSVGIVKRQRKGQISVNGEIIPIQTQINYN